MSCVAADGSVRMHSALAPATCKLLVFTLKRGLPLVSGLYTQLSAPSATQVDPRHFHTLGHWSREKTMETILIDLRKEMQQSHNRKLPQPPEGTRYSS